MHKTPIYLKWVSTVYDHQRIIQDTRLLIDIPVIIFCPTNKNPLREEAIPYFEELKKSKIFHETTESVSEHLNEIWNEIDEWWNKKDVQHVRKKFCQKYAKYDSKKIENLKNIILNTSKTYN